MKPFVTAIWSDLLIVSYPVPDEILLSYLPKGLTLDKFNGSAYISVVAFHFGQTRVLGINPPLSKLFNFPQWNLRFYVRVGDERGIVFIKEYVPNPVVAKSVRLLYNEPYISAPFTYQATENHENRQVSYNLVVDGNLQQLKATAILPRSLPKPDTMGEFVTKQGWGCGQSRTGKSTRFQVTHPPWRNYVLASASVEVDFKLLYGEEWAFLNREKPDSIILCEGSTVGVSWAIRL